MQNFGLSLTWSQTLEDRFSHDEAHLSIRFDICSIIIQLKVDRKPPLYISSIKNFQYHQNNKSITCTCMYAAKDLKYMPNLCLMYT